MKKHEKQILIELVKNSKESDHKIGKKLKVSQSTVTRIRHKLEKQGYVRNYSLTPSLKKLGINLMVITFSKVKNPSGVITKECIDFMKKETNPLLFAFGEGMDKTGVFITIHRDYGEYAEFITKARTRLGDKLENLDMFVVPIGDTVKIFSLSEPIEKIIKES